MVGWCCRLFLKGPCTWLIHTGPLPLSQELTVPGVTEDRCHSLCSIDTPSLEGRERREHRRPQRHTPLEDLGVIWGVPIGHLFYSSLRFQVNLASPFTGEANSSLKYLSEQIGTGRASKGSGVTRGSRGMQRWESVRAWPSFLQALMLVFCSASRKQSSEDSPRGPEPAPVGEEEVLL